MQNMFLRFLIMILALIICNTRLKGGGGEIAEGENTDAMVDNYNSVNNGAFNTLYSIPVGGLSSGGKQFNTAMVEAFALPYLAAGQTITNATISFYRIPEGAPISGNGQVNFNLQLYGLKRVSTAAQRGTDGVCDGTNKFTSASGKFTSSYVGQYITITQVTVVNGNTTSTKLGTYKVLNVTGQTSLTLNGTIASATGLQYFLGGPKIVAADWYVGANDSANTLMTANFMTPNTGVSQLISYSGSNLVNFIQTQYGNPSFSGQDLTNTRYIYFRLNPDSPSNLSNHYDIASSRSFEPTYRPTLSLTISGGINNVAGRLQFSFFLPQDSTTSAGVYNSTTGVLIRTLWNNVKFQAGQNYGAWDGKDGSGNSVTTGTNYKIKLIYHNVQYVWDGIVGNTSANQRGTQVYTSFLNFQDLAISGNNAFYTVGYNEAANPFNGFNTSTPQVRNRLFSGSGSANFSDVNAGFQWVAADSNKSYWAKVSEGQGGLFTFVLAITTSTDTIYTFPHGVDPRSVHPPANNQQNSNYVSVIDFDSTSGAPNPASGLAVQQNGNLLFVSHKNLNLVRVFDKVEGTLVGSFTVTSPSAMSTTSNGDVWVVSNSSPPAVTRYSVSSLNGSATSVVTLAGSNAPIAPLGLGVSADDTAVLVTDGGNSQQIKAYDNRTGNLLWTHGLAGGLAANGPLVSPSDANRADISKDAYDFSGHSTCAFQADNSFWVLDAGNNRFIHYGLNGSTLNYKEQIIYSGASYHSTVDLTDATRVFNGFLEYKVDYTKNLGGTNGSWSLVNNWLYGIPNDAVHSYKGVGFSNVVTLSNGRTYGFIHNNASNKQNSSTDDLVELSSSGPARLTGYSSPLSPRMYQDGSLRYYIFNNNLLSFYSLPLTGFDSENNPIWGSPQLLGSVTLGTKDPAPYGGQAPLRTEVTAGGLVIDFDASKNQCYHLGGISLGSSTFSWEASPAIDNTEIFFPTDGRYDIGNGVNYAGSAVMALGRNIIYGYIGELWSSGEASQWINYFDNGLMVGRFGRYETIEDIGPNTVDGYAGNSYASTLVYGTDGKAYLYHNDESNHGGIVRWRIDGWDTIKEISATAALGSTSSLSTSNTAPSVTLTSPLQNAVYSNGSNITLGVEAASASGASITSVQFFDGATSVGTLSTPPFVLNNVVLGVGTHSISATATDSNGLTATDTVNNITIGSDGLIAPPASPILSLGAITSNSVTINWPTASLKSSTIGQIVSFQFDSPSDANALTPSDSAGMSPYVASNFNHTGSAPKDFGLIDAVNNKGAILSNLGVGMGGNLFANSTSKFTGTIKKLFSTAFQSFNTSGFYLTNIPFASYDLVIYSVNNNTGSSTSPSFTVADNSIGTAGHANSITINQSFDTTAISTYTSQSYTFGGPGGTATDKNTIIIQGMNAPQFNLTGTSIEALQVVERPYDRGLPTSFSIERLGANGLFTPIGTVSGSTFTFTDSAANHTNVTPGTTYQYRIRAINGYGLSSYSNVVSAATPAIAGSTSFAAWQALYYNTAQINDPTIGGPNGDPYATGVPNLLAYALQLDPRTAQLTDVPTPTINSNGHLTVTYLQPSSITDINYIVEVTPDLTLSPWPTGNTQVVANVSSAAGNTITVEDTLPVSATKRFMRLRVTQKP